MRTDLRHLLLLGTAALSINLLSLPLEALPPAPVPQCNQSLRGRVASLDLAQSRITVLSNLTPPPGVVFAMDGATDFRGLATTMAELQVGMDVDVDYCLISSPWYADRITSSAAATPPAGALVVDLHPGLVTPIPVSHIFGDDPGESLAGSQGDGMAFGDMNGDGYADAIVVGGRSPMSFSKAVVVTYGGPAVAGTDVDLNTDGAVSAAGETRIQPTVSFQNIGRTVASGDIDGDGFDDVLLGQDAGVHVVFGRAGLPGRTIALDPAVTGAGQFRLWTDVPPATLASGDLNGDGVDDLIADAGAKGLIVVYGRRGLRNATVDLRAPTGAVAGVTRIVNPNTGSTVSDLATGDVNGDGFDDLVIALQRTVNPILTSAIVVYGSETLPGSVLDLAIPHSGGTPFETRITGRGMNAAACGDFDDDGFDDVLLASANVTGPGDNFAVGEVNVIYGAANLPGASLSLVTGSVLPNETRLTGLEEFGFFGTGLATADFDGDGFMDLVMGAPGSVPYGTLPETNAVSDGAVYVLRGRNTLRGVQLLDPREVADVYVFASARNDRFGSVLAAGADMDRDGMPEIAGTAATGENPALGPENGAGWAAILFAHGLAPRPFVRVRRAQRAGDGPDGSRVPACDFGPVVRAVLDFDDDDASAASSATAFLVRQPRFQAASVSWALTTNRTGWNGATLTFRYTDAEIAGLRESRLAVWRADTLSGPFTLVGGVADVDRNEITVTVDQLGVFTLAEGPIHPPVRRR